ncbi:hypothetical protein [Flavobacterium hydatis]|uniref:Uncharacterized protein n=1 Tax=Flavobacterium hydatis TaxID=991 RepID=A0A086AUH9_FLAHY|nr:hypothetical protein [Flavobacterium hydatis]KFF20343.1 hypothetical protein IW20_00870 [Flavobacterium hydatis]OXA98367.1 hypothetical protein B0A62_00785 [Flavobacterium hydatis]
MNELIIESKGIRTNQYFIPPFELRKGELVVIYLGGGLHFDIMKAELIAIFAGRAHHENVKIYKPLTFAEPFKESFFRRMFHPVTVSNYLKKNSDPKSTMISKIFEIDTFARKDKMNDLDTSQKKRLSLCSVLSRTRNVVFDLRGEGPVGANETVKFLNGEIKNDGAAILIDWADDMKDNCSKFIAIEWLLDDEELRKMGNRSLKLSQMY